MKEVPKQKSFAQVMRERIPPRFDWLERPIFWFLSVTEAMPVIERCSGQGPLHFAQGVLSELEISCHLRGGADLGEPGESLVVVANHPSGIVEALAAIAAILPKRPDMRLLANRHVYCFHALSPCFISVTPQSTGQPNAKAKKEAKAHLANGGCLLVFPAGIVASQRRDRYAVDEPWRFGTGEIIRSTRADVLPLGVRGLNSRLFYWIRRRSRMLSTLLLMREFFRWTQKTFVGQWGSRIPFEEIEHLRSEELVERLYTTTHSLL